MFPIVECPYWVFPYINFQTDFISTFITFSVKDAFIFRLCSHFTLITIYAVKIHI